MLTGNFVGHNFRSLQGVACAAGMSGVSALFLLPRSGAGVAFSFLISTKRQFSNFWNTDNSAMQAIGLYYGSIFTTFPANKINGAAVSAPFSFYSHYAAPTAALNTPEKPDHQAAVLPVLSENPTSKYL